MIFLLSLGEIGREIMEMSACLILDGFLKDMLFTDVLLNCTDMHCLKSLVIIIISS